MDELDPHTHEPRGHLPAFAQIILSQLDQVRKEQGRQGLVLDEMHLSIKGDRLTPGLQEQGRDHERRLVSLEGKHKSFADRAWQLAQLPIGTAIGAIASTLAAQWRGHP
jgi:hypothetical protein